MEDIQIQQMPWNIQALYHKEKRLNLQKQLGKRCTHVCSVKQGSERLLKVIMLNEIGGRDIIMLKSSGQMGDEFYKNVKLQILSDES